MIKRTAITEAEAIEALTVGAIYLRRIGGEFKLYVDGGGTIHLMRGDSHDEHGRPRKDAVVSSAYGVIISGGDW